MFEIDLWEIRKVAKVIRALGFEKGEITKVITEELDDQGTLIGYSYFFFYKPHSFGSNSLEDLSVMSSLTLTFSELQNLMP